MKLKLLSLAALAGITGFIAHNILDNSNHVKVGKYAPRTIENKNQNEAAGGLAYLAKIRGDINTGVVNPLLVENAVNQIRQSSASRSSNSLGLEFEYMGPTNVGGRTRGIVVDNKDSNRVYAASVTGGVFVSTNGGSTWTASWKDSDQNYIRTNNVSCLAQGADGVLYAGTGCAFEGNYAGGQGNAPAGDGRGVFRSTDQGKTWSLIPSTSVDIVPAFAEVNDFKAHPTNPKVLLAGTKNGLYVSTDGGDNWTRESTCLTAGRADFGRVYSIDWSKDGETAYIALGTSLYRGKTADLTTNCGCTRTPNVSNDARWKISVSQENEKKIYAILTTGQFNGNDLNDIIVSTDNGDTWSSMNPPIPKSAAHYDLFGRSRGSGQAHYDLAFKVIPKINSDGSTTDVIFVGGVQLWRFDGNWTMAAIQGSSGGSPNQYAMHPDHHIVTFDSKNPKNVYFGNDGGIFKSLDGGYTFFDMNKGYTTTQFYGIDHAKFDYAVGGTQDNGNLFVSPNRPGNPTYSASVHNQGVVNGDGFEAAVSSIADLKYTSAQNGNIGRGKIASAQGSGACDAYCGRAPFVTRLKLWESANDLSSKDSIAFSLDTISYNVGVGTGSRKTYQGQIVPFQNSIDLIEGSIKIGTVDEVLTYDGKGGFTGNGSGTLDEKTLKFSITFNDAPKVNRLINATYAYNLHPGAVIEVPSQTENIPIRYVVQVSLNPGDVMKIQDPIQSIIGTTVTSRCDPNSDGSSDCSNNAGIIIARKAIVLGSNPEWIHLKRGNVGIFEFSPNGKELFFSSGGSVFMAQGIDQIYSQADADKISNKGTYPAQQILSPIGATVTSISFNPNNPNQILVTGGNYGTVLNQHLFLLERTPGTNIFRSTLIPLNTTGSTLPLNIPVYDAIFDKHNPKRVIIGTDLGIMSTNDITQGASTQWSQEDFPLLPVFDIDQQTLPLSECTNEGMVYVGTFGGGIWKTGSIVGIEEITSNNKSAWESDILVYPNPLRSSGELKLTVNDPSQTQIHVYNLSGNLVKTIRPSLSIGENVVPFNVSDLPAGNYLISMRDGNTRKVAKFIKMN